MEYIIAVLERFSRNYITEFLLSDIFKVNKKSVIREN